MPGHIRKYIVTLVLNVIGEQGAVLVSSRLHVPLRQYVGENR